MTLLRIAALLLAASASGCTSAPPSMPDAPRRLLASMTITNSAHTGPIARKTGFEFQVIEFPSNLGGPVLEVQEFRDGKLVDSFDFGTSTTELAAIESVGLAPFDFESEVAAATERAQAEAEANGDIFLHGVRDGAEWEIVIVTKAGRFSVRAWNPVSEADSLAPYSENLRKLQAVIDLLTHYYGRYKLGL